MRVTQLSKLQSWKNVTFKDLPQLNSGREHHACGSYWLNGDLILIVAGGDSDTNVLGEPLSSTEVMNFMDQSTGWRETTALPSPRFALAGATLSGVFHVIGGSRRVNHYCDNNTEILSWDPVGENWNLVGQTLLPRDQHAVTVVNLDNLKPICFTSPIITTTTSPITTTNTNSTSVKTLTVISHVLWIALLTIMR